MQDEKFIYLATINVPSSMCYSDKFTLFVEIKATFIHADTGIPEFVTEVNNLNIVVASAINWNRFTEYVESICKIHFEISLGFKK